MTTYLHILALSLSLLMVPAIAHADVTGKARVVDGDTLHINQTKIRLHGIDAPETKQECYRVDGSPYIAAKKPLKTHCASS